MTDSARRPMAEGSLQTHTSSPREEPRRGYLLVFDGDTSRTFALPDSGAVVVGRAEDAELRVPSTSVSRRHARFDVSATGTWVRDLESHNGTLVNGERITEPVRLARGDVVTLGEVTLVLQGAHAGDAVAVTLDGDALRRRLQEEVARAVSRARPLSVLWIDLSEGSDPAAAAATLGAVLRRWDVIGTGAPSALAILLPEAEPEDGHELARRAVERLGAARAGLASCPRDGTDADALLAAARTAPRREEGRATPAAVTGATVLRVGDREILVAEPAMARTFDLVRRLAAADLPVLVVGETGSGKDLVAAALHHWSRRAAAPLLALNCAALQETLVESELFGFARGAFSGAVAAKPGLLEAAAGGTVFLDEVGELSPAIQAKLLRALETKRVTRVGEVAEREVDMRVVAATNRDLEADARSGRFRADLYYRLGAATVWVPPLRDRPRELPGLAARFLEAACRASGREVLRVSDAALRALTAHGWPGNVRELKNVMEALAATAIGETIDAADVADRLGRASSPSTPTAVDGTPAFRPIDEEVRELEKRRMTEALRSTDGHAPRAAALIGMPLRTFYTKAKLYGLARHS